MLLEQDSVSSFLLPAGKEFQEMELGADSQCMFVDLDLSKDNPSDIYKQTNKQIEVIFFDKNDATRRMKEQRPTFYL